MATLTALGLLGLATAAADGPPPGTLAAPPEAPSGALRVALPDDPWSSPDIVAPRMDGGPAGPDGPDQTQAGTPAPHTDRPLPRRTVPSLRAESPPDRTSGGGFRTTLALGGVVGLIILLAWGPS